jgi:DNA-binding transcriptional LysR family regulator
MEIQQLKYFLEVAEKGNFTAASAELSISQSSLSKHIKALEEELGVKLLDRNTRSVKLTEAGSEFKEYAFRTVEAYREIMFRMDEYRDKNKKTLAIGTIPVMSQYGITSLIAAFMKQHKDIDVDIVEGRGHEVLELLDSMKVDLAFIRTVSLPGKGYRVNPLVDDELVLVVPCDHPLADRESVDLAMAANENFIFLDSGPGIHDLCLKACRESGFEPRILHEYSRIETIVGVVREGIGVSLLMRKVVEYFESKDVKVVKLDRGHATTLALVSLQHKRQTALMKKFSAFTEDWFRL